MSTSKVVYNGETLIDISEDTVTEETLAAGITAHNSNGEQIKGTMVSVQADLAQTDPEQPDYVKGQEVIDEKIEAYAVAKTEKGAVGGIATLDENGKIPLSQIPDGISTGPTNNAEFTVSNTTGWLSKAVAYGSECTLNFNWSSVEDGISTGNGTVKISIGDTVKAMYQEEQGDIEVNIDNYLLAGKNTVGIEISDLYGNTRKYVFSINCVKIGIASYFDSNVAYQGDIVFPYTPTGAVEKTVHFLVDGEEIGTETVTVSGREQSFTIDALTHGSHSLEVYFSCTIDGGNTESNHLLYELICTEEGNSTPIIACLLSTDTVKQFASLSLPYIIYDPLKLSSEVTITDNFGFSTTRTVDRTLQPFTYKAENVGETKITFTVGEISLTKSFTTKENVISVKAETGALELHLSSAGRSNSEQEPLKWAYGDVEAELTGFNLTNDGWQESGSDTVLRVTGDARVTIPFKIFENDFRTNGKTIEFEFATRDVLNYDTEIIKCISGGRGIVITAQQAALSFEGGEISTQYKEDEHIRIAFTVEKKAENRLVKIFIDGIMSGAIQYAEDTDFSQASPVDISIGSKDCTVDLYCIRVYGNNLSQYQVLNNWIADTQDLEELVIKYDRNNIFDEYGNIDINALPASLPYMVLEAESYAYLPQYKGDNERPVNGRYIDTMHPGRSFTFNQAKINVQGTSSQYYSRKNYKINFKNGFIIDGVTKESYQLRETSVPTSEFTFKADVASSEGVNNVGLVKLYDDACPYKTPPQEEDSRIRQGIEGYPMLMFYYDGTYYNFLGKYNFNNDKGTGEVYGLDENDESWETLLNNTDMAKWKNPDFTSTYFDEEEGKIKPTWTKTFEARHPEDNTETANLQALAEWLNSTDTTAVDTEEEKTARLEKFTSELSEWFDVDMLIFNYIFTELFLLVDNRAKNAFPTRFDENGKWVMLPYDYDTALGTNNEGKLQFGYQFEDTDFIRGKELITAERAEEEGIDVETDDTVDFTYNGQDSILYVNLRLCFSREIKAMYQQLRSAGTLSYEEVEKRFSEHQSVWGEAVFNEDARFKYIEPLTEEGNSTYLPMLQGSKASQRKWWLYNRFRYLDSKYNTGDAKKDFINLKAFALSDVTITPYADIYASADFDGIFRQVRAFRGNTYTIENPADTAQGQVIAIYSAPQIAQIGDLSGFDLGLADFSKATKLSGTLKIGDSERENAKLTELTIGNLTLLSAINAMNCTALAQTVDVSGCTNIEHLYFEGTQITGVTLPNGGILKTLHLPSTVANLTIRNQPLLTDFSMPSYENLTTLRLENLDVDLFDTLSMILQMPDNSRVRVLGVEWTIDTAEEIFEVFDRLDTYRGLDEYGNNVDKPQISGIIHTGTITSEQLKEMQSRYPNFTIDYEHISSVVNFYNYDGTLLHTTTVWDNGNCPDPIPEIGTPLRPETEESKFIYRGWSASLENITENKNIIALYDEYKKYYVSFVDNFGNAVSVGGKDTNIYYDKEGENVIFVPADLPNYSIVDGEGATWDYHFEGWSSDGINVIDIPAVSGTSYSLTYQAVFSEHRVYVVKFMNGSDIHSELHLYEGEKITVPETPARVSTYQYDYEFAGWTVDGNTVTDVAEIIGTEDITYIAKYTAIDRYYTVTFLNWNGDTVKSYSVKHDELPTCEDPTREETAQYFYDFDGWTPEVVKVTGEAVYTATYLATLRTYTVRWLNEDGASLLEEDVNVPYGTMPSYDGATPTKEATAQYTYTFAGWHIEISEVTGDITYKATYTAEVNTYTVTWKNADGTVLETDTKVPYGDMPEYNSATPTKTATAQYSYVFAGWDTEVSEVTGNVVYTAIFTQHIRSYAIKFVDYNGSVLKSETLEYGSMPTAPTPTRTGYDFTGWNSTVTTVTGDKTYTAQYTPKMYTITWKFGSQTKTTQCAYGSTPTPPSGFEVGASYTADGFTYTLKSWGNIGTATSNATYTATVSGSGSITSRFTKLGAHSSADGWDSFLNGTGCLILKSTWTYGHLYGFDFRKLRELSNVNITDIKATVEASKNGSSKVPLMPCYGFETSGDKYTTKTNILSESMSFNSYITDTQARHTRSFTETSSLSELITWANNNLDSFINGYDSNSFGIYLDKTYYVKLWSVELTVDFTFG